MQYGRNTVALHNGVIEQGGAQLNVDGSATLADGSFTADTPFEVRATIHNGSVADLQRTVGTNYPVSGVVNFSLQASGTENDAHGRGQLSVSGGEAYGHPIKTLTSDIVLANHEAAFENIRLEALGGVVAGTAAYNLNSRQIRTDLRGDNIDLEKISELQTVPLQERGTASFTLKTSGTLDQPMVDAHVEVANLVFNDEYQGGLVLDAVTPWEQAADYGALEVRQGDAGSRWHGGAEGRYGERSAPAVRATRHRSAAQRRTEGQDHRPFCDGWKWQLDRTIAQAARAQGHAAGGRFHRCGGEDPDSQRWSFSVGAGRRGDQRTAPDGGRRGHELQCWRHGGLEGGPSAESLRQGPRQHGAVARAGQRGHFLRLDRRRHHGARHHGEAGHERTGGDRPRRVLGDRPACRAGRTERNDGVQPGPAGSGTPDGTRGRRPGELLRLHHLSAIRLAST